MPILDKREKADLIRMMQDLAPNYTPEWLFTPDAPDPGSALALLFIGMFHENIKRFNRLPDKYYHAFLNLLDVQPMTAKPARAYLTFTLSSKGLQPVWVAQGTRVAAQGEEDDGEIFFETETDITVTPAKVAAMFSVSPREDRITQYQVGSPMTLFDVQSGMNLQEHAWYIAHDDMFHLGQGASIIVEVTHSRERYREKTLAQKLTNPDWVEWSFLSERGWAPFLAFRSEGNCIILKKNSQSTIVAGAVAERNHRWIRCRARSGGPAAAALEAIEIDGLRLQSRCDAEENPKGLAPDLVFGNDIHLPAAGCLPFGKVFALYDCFYIASEEVLSKRGSTVEIRLELDWMHDPIDEEAKATIDWKLIMKEPTLPVHTPRTEVSVTEVLWEYWNGRGWVRLPVNEGAEQVFDHNRERRNALIRFLCPDDLTPFAVNNQSGYWIRARVLHIDRLFAGAPLYVYPRLREIRLWYDYEQRMVAPVCMLTVNNLEWQEPRLTNGALSPPLTPFLGGKDRQSSTEFGFDLPPVGGPIQMYFSVREEASVGGQGPTYLWEYLRKGDTGTQWAPLKVEDETKGFRENGVIRFFGPGDMALEKRYHCTLYWLRCLRVGPVAGDETTGDGRVLPGPVIERLALNTVRALQKETVAREVPRKVSDSPPVFALSRAPVIAEEVWIDETGEVTEADATEMERDKAVPVQAVRDGEGRLQRLWVRWSPVNQLHFSSPHERHYRIDRSTGMITFGNGMRGKALPSKQIENIMVTYQTGGGEKGNLAIGAIKSLQSASPFIQEVVNLEPSGGGCDRESTEEALQRGPHRFKHRNRAVTAEDFEWLVREAFPDIAKVRCLTHRDGQMRRDDGAVTVVIYPKHKANLRAFAETRKQVKAHLLQRCPVHLALAQKVHVIEPAFLEISLTAGLVVATMEQAIPAERQATERVEQFLDPLQGNFDGKGWTIGQTIHPSLFYTLFKSIPTVLYVEHLVLKINRMEGTRREEIDISVMQRLPQGLIVSGQHGITARPD